MSGLQTGVRDHRARRHGLTAGGNAKQVVAGSFARARHGTTERQRHVSPLLERDDNQLYSLTAT